MSIHLHMPKEEQLALRQQFNFPESPTAWWTALKKSAEANLRRSSVKKYEMVYQQWETWCTQVGVDPVIAISSQNVQEFCDFRHVRSNATYSLLYTALREINRHRIIALPLISYTFQIDPMMLRFQCDSFQATRIPKIEDYAEREPIFLTENELRRVLSYYDENVVDRILIRDHAILCFLVSTGARRAEIQKAQWSDLNFEKHTFLIKNGKGGKRANAYFAIFREIAYEGIERWRKLQMEMKTPMNYVFLGFERNRTTPVCNKPISVDTIYNLVKRIGEELALGDLNPHDFRHSMITLLLHSGQSLQDVSNMVLHSDLGTTKGYAPDEVPFSVLTQIQIGAKI